MVERFVTAPVVLPPAPARTSFQRADLIFYGVNHSGDSFEARVFIDLPDADAATPRDHAAYAGSFNVFGHGGCFGDIGHCDVPTGPRDPFDHRPQHGLTAMVKTVTISDTLRQVVNTGHDTIALTVVAVTPGNATNAVLMFDTVRLVTYGAVATG